MTAQAGVRTAGLRGAAPLAREPGWWGMALFILAEAVLFSLMLASYFYLMSDAPAWPPDGIAKPDLLLPGIDTVILLGSSIPMFWATASIARGNRQQTSIALAVAAVMAIIFLAIQAYTLLNAEFSGRDSAYGSLYYTIELTHAAHLVVALLLLAMALIRNLLGHFDRDHRLGIETTAMYWHFVDIVWIFVFLSLHISPYVFAP